MGKTACKEAINVSNIKNKSINYVIPSWIPRNNSVKSYYALLSSAYFSLPSANRYQ